MHNQTYTFIDIMCVHNRLNKFKACVFLENFKTVIPR